MFDELHDKVIGGRGLMLSRTEAPSVLDGSTGTAIIKASDVTIATDD